MGLRLSTIFLSPHFSWMLNGSVIEGEKSDQYRIRLSRELINMSVACVAATFAEGSDQTVLTFHCEFNHSFKAICSPASLQLDRQLVRQTEC